MYILQSISREALIILPLFLSIVIAQYTGIANNITNSLKAGALWIQ